MVPGASLFLELLMSENQNPQKPTCPHCDEPLSAVDMPIELAWDNPIQNVCFNDSCPYFRKGWAWMLDNYNIKGSYRYRLVDPTTGHSSPLLVWSKTAIKDHIIDNGC